MKVYISVDIEGITGVTNWDEAKLGNTDHIWAAEQMTKETLAACEAAIEMGAKEILVKDAHDSARNIDITKLPRQATVIRGWTGCPESMMAGINQTFDAAMFIGYHSGSGSSGNPLSHTMDVSKPVYIKMNGELISEFTINAYIAAKYDVPVIFLSGDENICKQSKLLIEDIETVGVKRGVGDATFNMHPKVAIENIGAGVKKALTNIQKCKIKPLGDHKIEIRFKNHQDAHRAKFYPGVKLIDDHIIEYHAKDIDEMITTMMFIL